MLLAIQGEKKVIEEETKLLTRLLYKLANQMRHFKELTQLKLINKLALRHLQHLLPIENATLDQLPALQLQPLLEENRRAKSMIVRVGQQLKVLLQKGVFMSFAVLGLGCLGRLKSSLDQIEGRVRALERIVKEVTKRKQRDRNQEILEVSS